MASSQRARRKAGGKQESPAKFPSGPSCPQFSKERPASSDIKSFVVRASAGRSPLAPRSFVNAGVNRKTASAYSGAVLLFATRPSKQPAPRQGAADRGQRGAAEPHVADHHRSISSA